MAVVRIDPALARTRTAQVMGQAQHDIPLFHVSKAAPVQQLRERSAEAGVSVTGALLPLVARWLERHPSLNAHWGSDGPVLQEQVHLGVAWAHRENVLVVPALADCAAWDLRQFAEALAALKRRSAEDAFLSTDFKTPTFTVSNLGATGIDDFTSLVTPPQVAVLSVSAATIRPTERDGALVAEQVLPLTLGIDHRALDGAYAARALVDLAEAIAEGAA